MAKHHRRGNRSANKKKQRLRGSSSASTSAAKLEGRPASAQNATNVNKPKTAGIRGSVASAQTVTNVNKPKTAGIRGSGAAAAGQGTDKSLAMFTPVYGPMPWPWTIYGPHSPRLLTNYPHNIINQEIYITMDKIDIINKLGSFKGEDYPGPLLTIHGPKNLMEHLLRQPFHRGDWRYKMLTYPVLKTIEQLIPFPIPCPTSASTSVTSLTSISNKKSIINMHKINMVNKICLGLIKGERHDNIPLLTIHGPKNLMEHLLRQPFHRGDWRYKILTYPVLKTIELPLSMIYGVLPRANLCKKKVDNTMDKAILINMCLKTEDHPILTVHGRKNLMEHLFQQPFHCGDWRFKILTYPVIKTIMFPLPAFGPQPCPADWKSPKASRLVETSTFSTSTTATAGKAQRRQMQRVFGPQPCPANWKPASSPSTKVLIYGPKPCPANWKAPAILNKSTNTSKTTLIGRPFAKTSSIPSPPPMPPLARPSAPANVRPDAPRTFSSFNSRTTSFSSPLSSQASPFIFNSTPAVAAQRESLEKMYISACHSLGAFHLRASAYLRETQGNPHLAERIRQSASLQSAACIYWINAMHSSIYSPPSNFSLFNHCPSSNNPFSFNPIPNPNLYRFNPNHAGPNPFGFNSNPNPNLFSFIPNPSPNPFSFIANSNIIPNPFSFNYNSNPNPFSFNHNSNPNPFSFNSNSSSNLFSFNSNPNATLFSSFGHHHGHHHDHHQYRDHEVASTSTSQHHRHMPSHSRIKTKTKPSKANSKHKLKLNLDLIQKNKQECDHVDHLQPIKFDKEVDISCSLRSSRGASLGADTEASSTSLQECTKVPKLDLKFVDASMGKQHVNLVIKPKHDNQHKLEDLESEFLDEYDDDHDILSQGSTANTKKTTSLPSSFASTHIGSNSTHHAHVLDDLFSLSSFVAGPKLSLVESVFKPSSQYHGNGKAKLSLVGKDIFMFEAKLESLDGLSSNT